MSAGSKEKEKISFLSIRRFIGILSAIFKSDTKNNSTYQNEDVVQTSGELDQNDIAFNIIEESNIDDIFQAASAGEVELKEFIDKLDPASVEEIIQKWGKLASFEPRDSNLLIKLKEFISGFKDSREDVMCEFYLPLFEIHSPAVAGCQTKAVFGQSEKLSANLAVTILGNTIGGGREIKIAIKKGTDANAKCYTVFCPAKIVFRKMIFPNNPYVPPVYTTKCISYTHRIIKRDIFLGPHYCNQNPTNIPQILRKKNQQGLMLEFPDYAGLLPDDGGMEVIEAQDLVGKSYNFGWSGAVPDVANLGDSIPVSVKFDVTSTVIQEHSFEFRLSGGKKYFGFHPASDSASINCTWYQD